MIHKEGLTSDCRYRVGGGVVVRCGKKTGKSVRRRDGDEKGLEMKERRREGETKGTVWWKGTGRLNWGGHQRGLWLRNTNPSVVPRSRRSLASALKDMPASQRLPVETVLHRGAPRFVFFVFFWCFGLHFWGA